jgi:hypothetical protein
LPRAFATIRGTPKRERESETDREREGEREREREREKERERKKSLEHLLLFAARPKKRGGESRRPRVTRDKSRAEL